MNIFGFNKREEQGEEEDIVHRLDVFLDKLGQRADDLYTEVKASAQSVADEDTDSFKRNYLQFKAGIIAQFTGIMQKGADTFHNKVIPKASNFQRITLSTKYNAWHSRILNQMVKLFDDVQERDLEKEYAAAMDQYNRNRNNYHCKQCSGKLEVDQFYFLVTYIKCPYCQTQNTFDPGSKAKMVEHLARPLAEFRCRDLKKKHREIRQQNGSEAGIESYEVYAKALTEEMDRILPGLQSQHLDFYNRLVHDYSAYGASW